MNEQELDKFLRTCSEEQAAEALVAGLIESGSRARVTRDEKGVLLVAEILDENGDPVFRIGKREYLPEKGEEDHEKMGR